MSTDILTVTLNPALDVTTSVPHVARSEKLRCTRPHIDPGGGGINVARAIRQLGGQATALVATGGATGAQLMQLLTAEGVPLVAFQGPGDTRQSLSVNETSSGAQYRFVLPGPEWNATDVTRALTAIVQATNAQTLVVLSGSQPPGVAKEFPRMLADHISGRDARLIVDTSGPALTNLVTAPHPAVFVLRMDSAEAGELSGRALPTRADTADFAQSLAAKGVAQNIIIARGADGSVLANAEARWHCTGADIKVISRVGAGDSFVGAFTLAASQKLPLPDCLRSGAAAASAACTTEATRLCDKNVTGTLLQECLLSQI